jgi:hypothetical protein
VRPSPARDRHPAAHLGRASFIGDGGAGLPAESARTSARTASKSIAESYRGHVEHNPPQPDERVQSPAVSMHLCRGTDMPQAVILDRHAKVRPRQVDARHEVAVSVDDSELSLGPREAGERQPRPKPDSGGDSAPPSTRDTARSNLRNRGLCLTRPARVSVSLRATGRSAELVCRQKPGVDRIPTAKQLSPESRRHRHGVQPYGSPCDRLHPSDDLWISHVIGVWITRQPPPGASGPGWSPTGQPKRNRCPFGDQLVERRARPTRCRVARNVRCGR